MACAYCNDNVPFYDEYLVQGNNTLRLKVEDGYLCIDEMNDEEEVNTNVAEISFCPFCGVKL